MTADPLRVLVVDDDADIRTILAMNLEASGYRVVAVDNGATARITARQMRPDVIVLDQMMPGLDGIEVLLGLQAHADTADIPVLMLTARASDDDVWAGWQAGVSSYMTKPFDIEDFLRCVERLPREHPVGRHG